MSATRALLGIRASEYELGDLDAHSTVPSVAKLALTTYTTIPTTTGAI
jgi:hypothetical protein